MSRHELRSDLSADRIEELWELAIHGEPGTEIVYPRDAPALLEAWAARANTDELVMALDASCHFWTLEPLYEALAPHQIECIKRARLRSDTVFTVVDEAIVARRRRFFFLARTTITLDEWTAIEHYDSAQLIEPGYGALAVRYPGVRTRLAAAAPSIHAWVARELAQVPQIFDSAGATTMLLWACVVTGPDDPLVAPVAAIMNRAKRQFASLKARTEVAAFFARVLAEAVEPRATLAALRKRAKDRQVIDTYDRAEAQLSAP